MTKFYDAVYSFERVRGCQFLKLYISMFDKWLESPQWLLAVSKPKVRMCVTSAFSIIITGNIYIYICIWISVCMYVCIYIYMCVCVCVCIS